MIGLCTGGYGREELISAGAVCVYDDLRHLMCDLVQAFRLCERGASCPNGVRLSVAREAGSDDGEAHVRGRPWPARP